MLTPPGEAKKVIKTTHQNHAIHCLLLIKQFPK